jgi:hypothetical protein
MPYRRWNAKMGSQARTLSGLEGFGKVSKVLLRHQRPQKPSGTKRPSAKRTNTVDRLTESFTAEAPAGSVTGATTVVSVSAPRLPIKATGVTDSEPVTSPQEYSKPDAARYETQVRSCTKEKMSRGTHQSQRVSAPGTNLSKKYRSHNQYRLLSPVYSAREWCRPKK